MRHTDDQVENAARRFEKLADALDPQDVEVEVTADLHAVAVMADSDPRRRNTASRGGRRCYPSEPGRRRHRPKVAWEGQKRTVLHPLEFAALLSAARTSSPNDHALVCLLGVLGLRVSEACGADVTDIRYESGYELLHVIGKGAKPADIPLPIPVLRAVREAIDGRAAGPILRTRTGRADGPRRRQPGSHTGRPCRRHQPPDQPPWPAPHLLHHRARRRHRHPRHAVRDATRRPGTTLRYDMAKANLDRHAAHAVAAYLAGMSTG